MQWAAAFQAALYEALSACPAQHPHTAPPAMQQGPPAAWHLQNQTPLAHLNPRQAQPLPHRYIAERVARPAQSGCCVVLLHAILQIYWQAVVIVSCQ
jgi:hypothetical protein